jgi:hypothetical protein
VVGGFAGRRERCSPVRGAAKLLDGQLRQFGDVRILRHRIDRVEVVLGDDGGEGAGAVLCTCQVAGDLHVGRLAITAGQRPVRHLTHRGLHKDQMAALVAEPGVVDAEDLQAHQLADHAVEVRDVGAQDLDRVAGEGLAQDAPPVDDPTLGSRQRVEPRGDERLK